MRLHLICASTALLASVSSAQLAQNLHGTTLKTPGQAPVPAATSGSFSGGGGTCATPTFVGTGPLVAVPFDNTTPASGGIPTNPFELICEHGGQLGIDAEEWFSWTAMTTGVAAIDVCGQSTVDTKIAIYADDCANILTLNPLACKDDSFFCNPPALQTRVTWDCSAGTTYLIQLGTFVTSPGGIGAFDVQELPARVAGQIDLGTSTNATGTGGANFDFMIGHTYDAGAGELLNSVDIAWGSPGAPALPVGLALRLVIYSGDAGANGTNLIYLADQTIVHSMENTDTFVNYPLTSPVSVTGLYSVAIVAALDGATNGAHFPFGTDDTVNSLDAATGVRRAWDAFEQANAPFDIMNPALAEFPPLDTQVGGDDLVYMIRVNTTPDAPAFNDVCNGDGGDQAGCTDCPCGNNAVAGTIGGCINSSGNGSRLGATGSPSVSLPSGDSTDLRFTMSGGPATSTSVLLSGDAVAPTNMANPCFGLNSGAQSIDRDGLRCAVQNLQRHGNRQTNASGDIDASSGPNRVWGGEAQPVDGIAVQGGFASGQTRFFQVTHRDLTTAVCMRGLNTSQAVEVMFTP